MGFVGSDLWKVRQKWGRDALVWPSVCVIVINDQQQIWMGHRADIPRWSLLGGFYEIGEGAEGCARREIQEEAGLEVSALSMIGVLTDAALTTTTYPNGDTVQSPAHVFLAAVGNGTVTLDDEHRDYIWAALHQAISLATTDTYDSVALNMYQMWTETKQFQIR
jgi:ADP-ribose pyrophosphatase YjhB (NUDIX family)